MLGKLLVLIGLPKSGKSTYAQKWLNEIVYYSESSDGKYIYPKVVINADQVRLTIHGQRFIKSAEPFVWAVVETMVKTLFSAGYYICIDNTNFSAYSIRQWLEIDPATEFHYIECPIWECQKRAIDNNMPDLLSVIDRMNNNLLKTYTDMMMKLGYSDTVCATVKSLNNTHIDFIVENIRRDITCTNNIYKD